MLEDQTDTSKKIVATIPGQNFTSDINSNFSSFDWYDEAVSNTSKLVRIANTTNDPFSGNMNFSIGYAMGLQVGNINGVIGVHYDYDSVHNLIQPLVSRTTAQVLYSIYDDNKVFVKDDPEDIIETLRNLTELDTAIYEDNQISKDVVQSGSTYRLRKTINKSNSGSKYKYVATLSPYTNSGSDMSSFEYQVVLLQTENVVTAFTDHLDDLLNDKFNGLIGFVVLFTFILLVVIGLIVGYYYTWKQIKDVTDLVELTSDIHKETKLDEIRLMIKNNDLFKEFVFGTYKMGREISMDEIDVLLSLYYNYFIDNFNRQKKKLGQNHHQMHKKDAKIDILTISKNIFRSQNFKRKQAFIDNLEEYKSEGEHDSDQSDDQFKIISNNEPEEEKRMPDIHASVDDDDSELKQDYHSELNLDDDTLGHSENDERKTFKISDKLENEFSADIGPPIPLLWEDIIKE